MRAMSGLLITSVAIVAGCARFSDRTINLRASEIRIDSPIQLLRSDVVGEMVFSSDGRLAAVASVAHDKTSRLEVRETASGVVVYVREFQDETWQPVLCSDLGESLFCAVQRQDDSELSAVHLASGQVTIAYGPEVRGRLYFVSRNYDHTLAFGLLVGKQKLELILLVTRSGQVVELPTEPSAQGFDMYGNLWLRYGKAWTTYSKDGRAAKGLKKPSYLVEDQSRVRGAMWLTSTDAQMEHDGSKAYVSAVWLSHRRAVPRPSKQGEPEDKGWRAALVDVCPDLWDFGFVPGRDMIYLVALTETKLVPFNESPK